MDSVSPSIAPTIPEIQADDLLAEIVAHLGAALMQVDPTDDPIIIGHVRAAHSLAQLLDRQRRAST